MKGLDNDGLEVSKLGDPEPRYSLGEILASGVYSDVHVAEDSQTNKRVAVKVLRYNTDTKREIEEEYKILRDLSSHPNLPDFYGVYMKRFGSPTRQDNIWLVMQLCEGGSVSDLARGLINSNRRLSEIHIAYILRETVKALNHLHEHHVLHRDVKGNNILLTHSGEVKLVDFGISREVGSTLGKCHSSLGTPSYMAPEVVTSESEKRPYDNRADVWALGVTAIELGDGVAPYHDMHPTRALFQIVRNPPPTLYRPANWTQDFNDFIAECLVKNPEHRPFMNEVVEHPFLTQLPENDFHLSRELQSLVESVRSSEMPARKPEFKVKTGKLKKREGESPEDMYLEDLAALEIVDEDSVLENLQLRFHRGQVYTFIGDILLYLNPHKKLDLYTPQIQNKYKSKSRSANEPHVYSVADAAYQDMLHHQVDQHIIFSGETLSGKTTQFNVVMDQLVCLGQSSHNVGDRVVRAREVLQAFGNAATPSNADSTRHVLHAEVTYSSSGTLSGSVFWLYQLEKSRVTQRNIHHANFHIFYYLYDSLVQAGTLETYKLEPSRNYRYLRREPLPEGNPSGPREDTQGNPSKLERIVENLKALGFEAQESETVWRVLAAILVIGDIELVPSEDDKAMLKETDLVDKAAELLGVDGKKLAWALTNSCVVESDTVSRRRRAFAEANRARASLARTLYGRLVDWLVNSINQKLALTRVVYGDKYCVSLLDYFGFECFPKNSLEQLLINTFNEQIQFLYNQKVFVAELMDRATEEVESGKLQYLDNKSTLDELMNKPDGVIYLLDEAEKTRQDYEFVMERLGANSGSRVEVSNEHNFSVAHYTGKVSYDITAMVSKNRDRLPSELIETVRLSSDKSVKSMFSQKLSKTGNLTVIAEKPVQPIDSKPKNKWGAALMSTETGKSSRRYNTASRGEYSQTRAARPVGSFYRSASIQLMRDLAEGSTHFVRCVRTSLGQGGFQPALVRQQMRALGLVDTANARKTGYPCRVPFAEFLKRYKFLAFEFDETVDETKDNCRLLLVRLKLEGYIMGKNKIFLKYFNEEYLSRLYEDQVKKIVKVQSMLRAFLAKRIIAKQKASRANSTDDGAPVAVPRVVITKQLNQDEAAVVIQKNIKGYVARKKYGPLLNSSGNIDKNTAAFIGKYARRWRSKSLFQVLLWYRTARHVDMVYFFQQVHLYSAHLVSSVKESDKCVAVDLNSLRMDVDSRGYVGEILPHPRRIPLNMKDLPFWDSSHLCTKYDGPPAYRVGDTWDSPFKNSYSRFGGSKVSERRKENVNRFIETPYTRNPTQTERFYADQPSIEVDALTPKKQRREVETNKPALEARPRSPVRERASPTASHGYVPVYNSHSQFVKTSNQNNPPPLELRKQLRRPPGPDPVKELKERSQSQDREDSDQPPFNFQAMLRKTNYTRESLKRTGEEIREATSDPRVVYQVKSKRAAPQPPTTNGSPNHMDQVNNNPRSKFKRQSSLEAIKAATALRSTTSMPQDNNNNGTELAPGVLLYGEAEEL